jgi:hypothetical protein
MATAASPLPSGDFRSSYAADMTIFPTRNSRLALLLGIALLCLSPLVLGRYELSLLIQIGFMGIAALGLNILVGFTGQISIGHAAFFGFGAFASAGIHQLGVPVALSIPLAGLGDGGGRAVLRAAGGAAEGAVPRHRDAGGAVHPGGLLRPRPLVLGRRGRAHHGELLAVRLPLRP